MLNLKSTILQLHNIDNGQSLNFPNDYCTPGFWVLMTALSSAKKYPLERIKFSSGDQKGYATTIGFEEHVTGVTCPYERPNSGRNYSPLIKLSDRGSTDQATTTINNCLRDICEDMEVDINDLCNVIGELHDNVWSHGMATGFSAAQKHKVPYEEDYYIEFALADSGMGLKREMERAGKPVTNHQEAIHWCIQEGHSTKLREDSWAQRIPDDMIGGSPYGSNIETFDNDNNHQGLGLFKLTSLIKKYSATLYLVTGDCLFCIDEDGAKSYMDTANYWQGVAISCRFRASRLRQGLVTDTDLDPEVIDIIDRLRRQK